MSIVLLVKTSFAFNIKIFANKWKKLKILKLKFEYYKQRKYCKKTIPTEIIFVKILLENIIEMNTYLSELEYNIEVMIFYIWLFLVQKHVIGIVLYYYLEITKLPTLYLNYFDKIFFRLVIANGDVRERNFTKKTS